MKKIFLRGGAATLAFVVFTTNVALCHATEINFWEQRRQSKAPVQLAALPSTFSPGLLPQTSSLSFLGSSAIISARLSASLPKGSEAALLPIIKALPQDVGSVRKIVAPSNFDRRGAQAAHTIIHIQDVHRNREAQENIGKAVQELVDNKVVDVVALEGAFTPMDFSWYRAYPYQDVVKAVADWLFREDRISGPVYTAFTSKNAIPQFIGIDQKSHYDANVEAYRQAAPLVALYKKKLESKTRELNERKIKTFNPALKNFDDQIAAYQKGSLPWGEYVRLLSRYTDDFSPKVETFLAALELEGKLNFAQVERERTQLITRLVAKLSKPETEDLFTQSAAYRMGGVNNSDFYSYLKNLCAKKDLNLSGYPAMDQYIRYVLLSDSLDVDAILKETASVEKRVYASLATTDEERELIQESHLDLLTGKLLDFALTKEEWDEYKTVIPAKAGIQAVNLFQNNVRNLDSRFRGNDGLESFEKFYREAEFRDEAMAANLEKAMDASNAKVAVIVTGGFHSEGMLRQLQPKGFTIISYVPKISKIEDENGSSYLSMFTQEKTPLDKLFAGEKLFLAGNPNDTDGPGTGEALRLTDLALHEDAPAAGLKKSVSGDMVTVSDRFMRIVVNVPLKKIVTVGVILTWGTFAAIGAHRLISLMSGEQVIGLLGFSFVALTAFVYFISNVKWPSLATNSGVDIPVNGLSLLVESIIRSMHSFMAQRPDPEVDLKENRLARPNLSHHRYSTKGIEPARMNTPLAAGETYKLPKSYSGDAPIVLTVGDIQANSVEVTVEDNPLVTLSVGQSTLYRRGAATTALQVTLLEVVDGKARLEFTRVRVKGSGGSTRRTMMSGLIGMFGLSALFGGRAVAQAQNAADKKAKVAAEFKEMDRKNAEGQYPPEKADYFGKYLNGIEHDGNPFFEKLAAADQVQFIISGTQKEALTRSKGFFGWVKTDKNAFHSFRVLVTWNTKAGEWVKNENKWKFQEAKDQPAVAGRWEVRDYDTFAPLPHVTVRYELDTRADAPNALAGSLVLTLEQGLGIKKGDRITQIDWQTGSPVESAWVFAGLTDKDEFEVPAEPIEVTMIAQKRINSAPKKSSLDLRAFIFGFGAIRTAVLLIGFIATAGSLFAQTPAINWIKSQKMDGQPLVASIQVPDADHRDENVDRVDPRAHEYLDGFANTFDQAMAAILFVHQGDQQAKLLAREILDGFQNAGGVPGKSNKEGTEITGEIIWTGFAAIHYQLQTGDARYEALLKEIDNYLLELQRDHHRIVGGPNETWTSTEHNEDAIVYLTARVLALKKSDPNRANQLDAVRKSVAEWFLSTYRKHGRDLPRGHNDNTFAVDVKFWGVLSMHAVKQMDPAFFAASGLAEIDLDRLLESAEKGKATDIKYKSPNGKEVTTSLYRFSETGPGSVEWSAYGVVAKNLQGHTDEAKVLLANLERLETTEGDRTSVPQATRAGKSFAYSGGWTVVPYGGVAPVVALEFAKKNRNIFLLVAPQTKPEIQKPAPHAGEPAKPQQVTAPSTDGLKLELQPEQTPKDAYDVFATKDLTPKESQNIMVQPTLTLDINGAKPNALSFISVEIPGQPAKGMFLRRYGTEWKVVDRAYNPIASKTKISVNSIGRIRIIIPTSEIQTNAQRIRVHLNPRGSGASVTIRAAAAPVETPKMTKKRAPKKTSSLIRGFGLKPVLVAMGILLGVPTLSVAGEMGGTVSQIYSNSLFAFSPTGIAIAVIALAAIVLALILEEQFFNRGQPLLVGVTDSGHRMAIPGQRPLLFPTHLFSDFRTEAERKKDDEKIKRELDRRVLPYWEREKVEPKPGDPYWIKQKKEEERRKLLGFSILIGFGLVIAQGADSQSLQQIVGYLGMVVVIGVLMAATVANDGDVKSSKDSSRNRFGSKSLMIALVTLGASVFSGVSASAQDVAKEFPVQVAKQAVTQANEWATVGTPIVAAVVVLVIVTLLMLNSNTRLASDALPSSNEDRDLKRVAADLAQGLQDPDDAKKILRTLPEVQRTGILNLISNVTRAEEIRMQLRSLFQAEARRRHLDVSGMKPAQSAAVAWSVLADLQKGDHPSRLQLKGAVTYTIDSRDTSDDIAASKIKEAYRLFDISDGNLILVGPQVKAEQFKTAMGFEVGDPRVRIAATEDPTFTENGEEDLDVVVATLGQQNFKNLTVLFGGDYHLTPAVVEIYHGKGYGILPRESYLNGWFGDVMSMDVAASVERAFKNLIYA